MRMNTVDRRVRFVGLVRRSVAVGVAATLCTGALGAQQSGGPPASVSVKRGDTLWGLAGTYLGNPERWPEIYRVNTSIIKDPHWIEPGQVLQLPGTHAAPPSTRIGSTTSGAIDSGVAPTPTVPPASTGPTVFSAGANSLIVRSAFACVITDASSGVQCVAQPRWDGGSRPVGR